MEKMQNAKNTEKIENMAILILQQDFFLEYIALNEKIGLFITLSELNKDFNSAMKLYKDNKTTWRFLCKRDFAKWMPKDDDEWSLHFLKIKPGNYFGMYCYLYGVLNQKCSVEIEISGVKIGYNEISITIPLYFVLKKYNGLKGEDLMCIPKSTRKMAIIQRISSFLKEEKLIVDRVDHILDLDTVPRICGAQFAPGALFIHAMCYMKNCSDCVFTKDLKLYDNYSQWSSCIHIRDEDNCLKQAKENFGYTYSIGVGAEWGFQGSFRGLVSFETYKNYSLCFSQNKVFSLA